MRRLPIPRQNDTAGWHCLHVSVKNTGRRRPVLTVCVHQHSRQQSRNQVAAGSVPQQIPGCLYPAVSGRFLHACCGNCGATAADPVPAGNGRRGLQPAYRGFVYPPGAVLAGRLLAGVLMSLATVGSSNTGSPRMNFAQRNERLIWPRAPSDRLPVTPW